VTVTVTMPVELFFAGDVRLGKTYVVDPHTFTSLLAGTSV